MKRSEDGKAVITEICSFITRDPFLAVQYVRIARGSTECHYHLQVIRSVCGFLAISIARCLHSGHLRRSRRSWWWVRRLCQCRPRSNDILISMAVAFLNKTLAASMHLNVCPLLGWRDISPEMKTPVRRGSFAPDMVMTIHGSGASRCWSRRRSVDQKKNLFKGKKQYVEFAL